MCATGARRMGRPPQAALLLGGAVKGSGRHGPVESIIPPQLQRTAYTCMLTVWTGRARSSKGRTPRDTLVRAAPGADWTALALEGGR